MANTKINSTVIATSDPIELSKGFALNPGHAMRLEKQFSAMPFWNSSSTILGTHVRTEARGAIDVGFAGPSYGVRMEVDGQLNDDEMYLNVNVDEMQGGILLGADFKITMSFEAKRKWIHLVKDGWHSHFETRWSELVDMVETMRFSGLFVIISLIKAGLALQLVGADTLAAFLPSLGTNGIWDSESGICRNGGKLTLHPQLMGNFDLITIVAYIIADGTEGIQPELIPLIEILKKIYTLMKDVGLSVSVGPTFGMDVPVDVSITKIRAIGQSQTVEFDDLSFQGGTFTTEEDRVTGKNPDGDADLPLKQVGLELTHKAGLDLRVGAFAGVSFLKVFAKSKRFAFDVFSALGMPYRVDAVKNDLNCDVDNPSVSTSGGLDVVLHPPEATS
jgi:hypothetical protein